MVPALYNLVGAKLLPEQFAILGFDLADISDHEWIQHLKEMTQEFIRTAGQDLHFDENVWKWFESRITYQRGDLNDPASYEAIKAKLAECDQKFQTGGNYLFYLAISDRFFGTVVDHLGECELAREDKGQWRRVVIEKPFGHDLASAKALNRRS